MKMKDSKKTIYYTDELNDEFASDGLEPIKIDENWIYVHKGWFKRFTRFFWYRIVAFPIAFVYLKCKYHLKIVNRKVIKQVGRTGFFMYGNHTHNMCDALIPTFVAFPESVYVIVHANNVSIPVLGKITPSLGAIPLPGDLAATRNFMKCIETRFRENRCIHIYPEAHIWPYYTKIRPFVDTSFRYPVQYDCPVICFTNTYQKRRFSKTPRIVTYVDGPFYVDGSLPKKEQRLDLRNRVYETMCKRAENSNVEIIKYVKREEEHD